MTEILQLFVLGMATGGFFTINALGVVVVFRSSGVINFTSGGIAMLAGYVEWDLADRRGWPHPLAILTTILVAAAIGALVYLLAIRPLSAASTLAQVIATLGLLVALQQVIVLVFGGSPELPSAYLPTRSLRFGSVAVGADSVILLAFTVTLTMVLWAVYRWTRFGVATSALAESPRSLAALGWNVGRLRTANWALGGALAGIAGAGLAPVLQLNTSTFGTMLVPTLASAVLGGLRSFPMTLAGGLLLGAAQAEANRYIGWSGAGDAVPFLILVVLLMLRGRSLPTRSAVQERLPRVGSGEIRVGLLLGGVVLAGLLGAVVQEDWVIGATVSLVTALILLSQVVITGYAGQLSLAQLTTGGVGAIVAANAAAAVHLPFLLSLLVGMLAVIPLSLAVGLPSLRSRGITLAIVTLAVAVAVNATVLTNTRLSGGLAGLTLEPQTLFGLSIDATLYPRRYFAVTLLVFLVAGVAVANLRRGRTGRRMLAVRSNERAAAAMGVNVIGLKLYAFTVAGVIAGAGGVLLVFRQSLPQFSGFDALAGLATLIAGVLGGIGYVIGAVLGGLFANGGLPNSILNPWVGNLTWWTNAVPLVTGVILVGQLMVNPHGIADVLARGPARVKRSRVIRLVSGLLGPTPLLARIPAPVRAWTRSLTPAATRANRAQRRRHRIDEQLRRATGGPRQRRSATLAVTDLRVRFGTVLAVDGVDLTLRGGEVLAVIGPNGAGKTTLMDAITGFVPMTGTVELDGRRIDRYPVHRRARAGIARSFQSLELLEDMTVLDNLRCAADPQDTRSLLFDLAHPDRGGLSPATAAAIATFGLHDQLDQMPTEIPYGTRRLVGIARAVAGQPGVVFLDEPAAGLSELERGEVARLIIMMAREWNIAVLLVEHDVDLVRQVADRAIALDFGRTLASGSPSDVLAHPDVVRAYLGDDDGTTAPESGPSRLRAELQSPTLSSPPRADRVADRATG